MFNIQFRRKVHVMSYKLSSIVRYFLTFVSSYRDQFAMLKDRLVEEKKELQLREKSQSKVTVSIKEIILQSILSFTARVNEILNGLYD